MKRMRVSRDKSVNELYKANIFFHKSLHFSFNKKKFWHLNTDKA